MTEKEFVYILLVVTVIFAIAVVFVFVPLAKVTKQRNDARQDVYAQIRKARLKCYANGYTELRGDIRIGTVEDIENFTTDTLYCYKLVDNTDVTVPLSSLE